MKDGGGERSGVLAYLSLPQQDFQAMRPSAFSRAGARHQTCNITFEVASIEGDMVDSETS